MENTVETFSQSPRAVLYRLMATRRNRQFRHCDPSVRLQERIFSPFARFQHWQHHRCSPTKTACTPAMLLCAAQRVRLLLSICLVWIAYLSLGGRHGTPPESKLDGSSCASLRLRVPSKSCLLEQGVTCPEDAIIAVGRGEVLMSAYELSTHLWSVWRKWGPDRSGVLQVSISLTT